MKRLLVIVWLLLAPAPAAANLRPLFSASANPLGAEVEPETDYRGWVGGGLLVLAVLAIGWLARRRAIPKNLGEQPGGGGGVRRDADDQGVR